MDIIYIHIYIHPYLYVYVVGLERVSKTVIFHTEKPMASATEKSRSSNISMLLTDREEKV